MPEFAPTIPTQPELPQDFTPAPIAEGPQRRMSPFEQEAVETAAADNLRIRETLKSAEQGVVDARINQGGGGMDMNKAAAEARKAADAARELTRNFGGNGTTYAENQAGKTVAADKFAPLRMEALRADAEAELAAKEAANQ